MAAFGRKLLCSLSTGHYEPKPAVRLVENPSPKDVFPSFGFARAAFADEGDDRIEHFENMRSRAEFCWPIGRAKHSVYCIFPPFLPWHSAVTWLQCFPIDRMAGFDSSCTVLMVLTDFVPKSLTYAFVFFRKINLPCCTYDRGDYEPDTRMEACFPTYFATSSR